MSAASQPTRFTASLLAGLAEPVRRYLSHAISEGAELGAGVSLTMTGRITVGLWRAFGYIPCGCEVEAERRFGALVVPSRISGAWWFGTPHQAPFYTAELRELAAGRRTPPHVAGRDEKPGRDQAVRRAPSSHGG